MALHSSILTWKIPWTEEPGRLQSVGLQRVVHDWVTSLHYFTSYFYHWRRKWQPTPVFLPGESHGQRILTGHGPWGHRELGMTEVTEHICRYMPTTSTNCVANWVRCNLFRPLQGCSVSPSSSTVTGNLIFPL